jgi:hypothetical protein
MVRFPPLTAKIDPLPTLLVKLHPHPMLLVASFAIFIAVTGVLSRTWGKILARTNLNVAFLC